MSVEAAMANGGSDVARLQATPGTPMEAGATGPMDKARIASLMRNEETAIVERILSYAAPRFLRVLEGNGSESARIMRRNGTWMRMTSGAAITATKEARAAIRTMRDDATQSAIDDVIEVFRDDPQACTDILSKVTDDMTEATAAMVVKALETTIISRRVSKRVHIADFNSSEARLCIPLIDSDEVWSMRHHRSLTRDEAAELLIDVKWSMSAPGDTHGTPGAKVVDDYIFGIWSDMFNRTCAAFASCETKRMDVIIAPVSSSGKTTWAEMLKLAFPGAAEKIDASKVFGAQGARFNSAARELTDRLIVFIDEWGNVKSPVRAGDLNKLTDTTIDVELKGQDSETRRRTGVPILAGSDAPDDFDAAQQGINTRLRCVIRLPEETLRQEHRDLMMSPDGINQLKARVLEKVNELLKNGDPWTATETQQMVQDADELRESRTDPLVSELRKLYEPNNKDFTANETITNVLATNMPDEEIPKFKAFGKMMRSAWPQVRPATVKNNRGWRITPRA